ncbi:MAG: helix-turn-helix domain-containing protein [Rhodobacteraceae bacterium]|jgi:DNA-binding transcriptional ArsR family regulator/uncharacterized protein YndB with AHSA1/START domain|nr:helix-turn-helix domain-containing protein [Paracoccaceae bacterium]MBL4558827.1 helix-turn-helix domain-containing protein [Paracoccaceae bacterium]HBG99381.1 ArsR family transcriptional regulator [Paracoccaceae bacterium]
MTDGPEPDLDAVFKALNDPTRRAILDALRARDGQSLTEIESDRALSRFGVMKHLKVLEDAGLVIPRRSGRFKHHFLNAVPLQQVIDRWIDPFVQKPLARLSLDLKTRLEGNAAMTDADAKPDFMLQTFIRCSPDALWEALTRADLMALYHFACDRVRGDAEPGATTEFLGADGSVLLAQTTLKLVPKRRIEMTFAPNFGDGIRDISRCVFLIEPEGAVCKLTIEHHALPAAQTVVREGWARWAAGLKSWLETGKALKAA